MKAARLALASLLFVGSGVGLFILNDGKSESSRDVLGSTVEESEAIHSEADTVELVEPATETEPEAPVDEGIQRQLDARTDSANDENCTEEGSVVVDIDEESENGVNISINSSQTARSGSVTNDGSGSATSGDVKTCSSADIKVDITN